MTAHEWEERELEDRKKVRKREGTAGYVVCTRCDATIWVRTGQTIEERVEETTGWALSRDCDEEIVRNVVDK